MQYCQVHYVLRISQYVINNDAFVPFRDTTNTTTIKLAMCITQTEPFISTLKVNKIVLPFDYLVYINGKKMLLFYCWNQTSGIKRKRINRS